MVYILIHSKWLGWYKFKNMEMKLKWNGEEDNKIKYGGKSALERAVDKAYYSGKGIAVYYQIHHSVQSYNRVSYVVE